MSLCSERSVGNVPRQAGPCPADRARRPNFACTLLLYQKAGLMPRAFPSPSLGSHCNPSGWMLFFQGAAQRAQRGGVSHPQSHSPAAAEAGSQARWLPGPSLNHRAVGSTHTSGITGNRHSFRDRFWLGHPGQGRVKASPTPAAHTQGRLWPDAQGITAPPRCTLASQVVLPCLPRLRSVPWSREDTAGCLNLSSVPPFREGLG